ncbi:hypothetical protein [Amaricoccus sp.]|uniref:hypothetical protein n=1 Tax=Amaricoccus sp. TaxID=1872485 RepID=UPI001B5F3029|nr:hypothetical protein [Amaricoccus sp.]MBP7001387.1 hypothetical protein [Amaricoccus sp.]
MRLNAILLFGGLAGGLAACTSGDITVPTDPVITQVPTTSASSSGGGGDFTSTIETALADPATPGAAPLPEHGTPLDDDNLNLTLYTIEQQKIDARIAERELAEARSQLVVVQPTQSSVPHADSSVNVTLYAQQSTNQVGQRMYQRRPGIGGGCGGYPSADAAQRAFLAAGGPNADPRGLDPDGDGFACSFDPEPYRQLKL